MKRESKVALFLSGSVMATGLGLAVLPMMESSLSRIMNRAEAAPNPPVISDFAPPGAMTMGPMSASKMNLSRASVAALPQNSRQMTAVDSPDADTPRFVVQDLSVLPNGEGFEPTAINNQGDIVGNYKIVTTIEPTKEARGEKPNPRRFRVTAQPAVFRGGKFESLATVPGYNWVYATSINDSGQVVGAARQLEDVGPPRLAMVNLPTPHVLRWDAGKLVDLTADFSQHADIDRDSRETRFSFGQGDPVFITNDGTIYAGFYNLYRWRAGNVSRFDAGYVRQVNERGIMIGMVPNRNMTTKPDNMAVAGGIGSLPLLQPGIVETESGKEFPLGRFSDEPCAINDNGLTVLRGYRNGGSTQFSLLRGGKAEPLATLLPCRGCLINNNGWVVMGDGMPDGLRPGTKINPQAGPFLRTSAGFYWLPELLTEPKNWILSNTIAINERNQILVFGYRVGDEKRHALLLTPTK